MKRSQTFDDLNDAKRQAVKQDESNVKHERFSKLGYIDERAWQEQAKRRLNVFQHFEQMCHKYHEEKNDKYGGKTMTPVSRSLSASERRELYPDGAVIKWQLWFGPVEFYVVDGHRSNGTPILYRLKEERRIWSSNPCETHSYNWPICDVDGWCKQSTSAMPKVRMYGALLRSSSHPPGTPRWQKTRESGSLWNGVVRKHTSFAD